MTSRTVSLLAALTASGMVAVSSVAWAGTLSLSPSGPPTASANTAAGDGVAVPGAPADAAPALQTAPSALDRFSSAPAIIASERAAAAASKSVASGDPGDAAEAPQQSSGLVGALSRLFQMSGK